VAKYDIGPESVDEVTALAYQELRAIAHRRLIARDHGGTLSTTALVHEAYLKLADQSRAGWRDQAHFLALASLAMRHVLVDRARERMALKRGGVRRQVTLNEDVVAVEDQPETLLQLDEALDRLSNVDPRLARVVECRFFGGMTIQDTADALGIAPATVSRGWAMAKAWLYRDLKNMLGDSP
jgi:RNA polymerase sigma factor (TIGR02999 family)